MTGKARFFIASVMICAFLVPTGCGSARRGEPLIGPVGLSDQARLGRVVFYANCDQCHPGGEAGLGPSLNNKPLPGFAIKTQVRHGLGAMPSFSNIQSRRGTWSISRLLPAGAKGKGASSRSWMFVVRSPASVLVVQISWLTVIACMKLI